MEPTTTGTESEELNGWSVFFTEVTALLDEAQKNYGIANHNYTDYALERMEMASVEHVFRNTPQIACSLA